MGQPGDCGGSYWVEQGYYPQLYYSEFWRQKIIGNVERDRKNTSLLEEAGWLVIRLWESDIRANRDECVSRIKEAYSARLSEIEKH